MNTNSSLYMELTNYEIKTIIKENFNTDIISEIKLISGGMFNTTYKICYGENKTEAVLRVGPINRHLLMGFEENLMEAEKYVYQLCQNNDVPCSDVLVCDTTKKIIDRDYMIVKYIKSILMSDNNISKEDKGELQKQVGIYMKKFHSIKHNKFGRVSHIVSKIEYNLWSECLIAEIDDIINRSQKFNAFSKEEINLIKSIFIKYKDLLDNITIAQLVHSDLWEGNILVNMENGRYKVVAIIDADRAIFGDVDFEFASPWMINDNFLEGYELDLTNYYSQDRKIRRKIYLMLFHIVEAYVGIAEYNNEKQYKNNKKVVLDLATELA